VQTAIEAWEEVEAKKQKELEDEIERIRKMNDLQERLRQEARLGIHRGESLTAFINREMWKLETWVDYNEMKVLAEDAYKDTQD